MKGHPLGTLERLRGAGGSPVPARAPGVCEQPRNRELPNKRVSFQEERSDALNVLGRLRDTLDSR